MTAPWLKSRAAGLFLHMSSLPSHMGIGNLGESAFSILEFMNKAGLSFWQMCPVGPTGFGDSPYQVFSSSAGNPYFIDWNPLIASNLIQEYELEKLKSLSFEFVDYGLLYQEFFKVLRIAFERFQKNTNSLEKLYGKYDLFVDKNRSWLEHYCLFQGFKVLYEGKPWWEWPVQHKDIITDVKNGSDYSFHEFIQFVFRSQWKKFKEHANNKKVKLIGDLPIYCAPDSSDVWAFPELFELNKIDNSFQKVAGVPPDYFNEDGQFWGNPLYEWDEHKKNGYKWWISRLEAQLDLFDVVRIDHFRGFNDYWSIDSETKDAKSGTWQKGPGLNFWKVIKDNFPTLPFLAEDLGLITKEVRQLREQIPLLGMAVLQFAFDGDSKNLYLPHNLNKSLVLYSGTHDNDTTIGWYKNSSNEIQDNFRSYFNISGEDASWDMIRSAYRSVSPLVITPVQDYLGLGSEARFNEPGIAEGNWQWRLSFDQLQHLHSNCGSYLLEQAKITGRIDSELKS